MTTVYCTQGHDNQDSNRFCQICGEKLPLPVAQNMLVAGNVLEDRYRIVQQIGQGGFGRTYLCENLTRFNEPCVLKEFAPQVQGTYALDKAKKLFEREASVLHNLTHSQIPRFRELFQLKSGSQGLFLVQDYVAGQTYRYLLATRQMQNRLFTEAEVRQLLVDTLPVLEYIHSLGVIHRDIAPDNLMLRSSDNLPVLIDFGGVKQIAVNAEIQATGNTEVPTCLGKVGYAPHEQMQRGTVAANSDLYALAATALVLLTGKEPTELIDPQSLTWNWRSVTTLDPQLGNILDRMLQPNPAARLQSAAEVLRALQQSAAPQIPVAVPVAKNVNAHAGTVVVAPAQKQAGAAATAITREDSSFMQILGRSWLGILAVGTVGGLAWAGSNMLGKSNSPIAPVSSPVTSQSPATPSATPSASSTAESPSSTNKPSTASSSGSDAGKTNSEKSPAAQGSTTTDNSSGQKPSKSTNTDNGNSSSSGVDRPRRTSTNSNVNNTPTRRTPAAEEPVTKPQVETYEVKPKPAKVEPSEPVTKPRVETYETKPKPTKVEPSKPATKPQVETYETKPRKKPETASKPNNSTSSESKKPVKKPESTGNSSSDDKEPLF
jgi:serine/threonine protein kinase, bacterial